MSTDRHPHDECLLCRCFACRRGPVDRVPNRDAYECSWCHSVITGIAIHERKTAT